MINKEEFKEYILSGKTIPELQDIYSISRTKVAQYKRDFGFVGLTPNSRKIDRKAGIKTCSSCLLELPLSNFYSNGTNNTGSTRYKPTCIICSNILTNKNYSDLIIDYLLSCGKTYSCEKCSYTGVWGSLDFHHVHPEDKLFSIGAPPSKSPSTQYFENVIVPELDKCLVLCPNCHRQEHLFMGRK